MKKNSVKKIVTAISLAFTSSLLASTAFAQSEDLQITNVFELGAKEKVETPKQQNQFVMESLAPKVNETIQHNVNNVGSHSSVVATTVQSHTTTTTMNSSNNSLINTSTKDTSSSLGKLTHIGEKNGNLEPLKGFAKDLPLLDVLKQITPNGWKVKKMTRSELNVKRTVSWSGGKTWVDTLEDIAKNNNLNVIVIWDKKEIIVGENKFIPSAITSTTVNSRVSSTTPEVTKSETLKKTIVQSTPQDNIKPSNTVNNTLTQTPTHVKRTPRVAQGIFELENGSTMEIATGNSQATEIRETSITKVEVKQEAKVFNPVKWVMLPSKSLKENVIEFGKSIGYKVVWNGEDYPVDEQRLLEGEFDSENGPIKQLSEDYGPRSRVQQPLAFQFFQNKTLVVENWKFEQNGYPQYNRE